MRANAAGQVVLVSGEPGIGKSSLVHDLIAEVSARHALTATSQADSVLRGEPLALMKQALRELVHTLLATPDDALSRLRSAIAAALGDDRAALMDVVPDLELLLGPQPAATQLAPSETRARLHGLVLRFLECVSAQDRPLVVFLDDIQWADDATLGLLRHLLSQPHLPPILVLLTLRGELADASPLVRESCTTSPPARPLLHLRPEPLARSVILSFLGDCLAVSRETDASTRPPSASEASDDLTDLAALLHARTLGNPFELTQLVRELLDQGTIAFDPDAARWRWSLDAIAARGLSEGIAARLARRLREESSRGRTLLQLAACLGNDIDPDLLARLTDRPPGEIHDELAAFARAGFLVPLGRSYRFGHEHLREAAYTLASPHERAAAHLSIGRGLLELVHPDDLAARTFELADHLALGAPLMCDPDERERAARICLDAARAAHATGAFESAERHCRNGAAMCAGTPAEKADLTFDLALLRARALAPTGAFDDAAAILEALQSTATHRHQKVFVHREQVDLFIARFDLMRAFSATLECLRLFDRAFALDPPTDLVRARHAEVQARLEGRSTERLGELPPLTDPEIGALLDLLRSFATAAFGLGRPLRDLVACEMMLLTLAHGIAESTAHACAHYGAFLIETLGELTQGARFTRFARGLVARKELRGGLARVYNICVNVESVTETFARLVALSEVGLHAARDVGDGVGACFNALQIAFNRLAAADPLPVVLLEAERSIDIARAACNGYSLELATMIRQAVRALRGETFGLASLASPDFDEASLVASVEAQPVPIAAHTYRSLTIVTRFLAGDFEGAWRLAERIAELAASGRWVLPGHPLAELLGALAGAAIANACTPERREVIVHHLASEEARWGHLAASMPDNFGAFHLLIRAERGRLDGDHRALPLYEDAMRTARASHLVHVEAIASELAARHLQSTGVEIAARAYLRKARRAFAQWGAVAKVEHLERLHPDLAELSALERSPRVPATSLDMLTLARASQAIGSELNLAELVPLLIRIAVQSSGARTGHLVLARGDRLEIAAGVDAAGREARHVVPLEAGHLAPSVILYAQRTHRVVILDEATTDVRFALDPYIQSRRPRSILCVPISRGPRISGLLYLENDLLAAAFTPERTALVEHLAAQAAISLDNAHLFSELRDAEAESARLTANLRRLATEIIDAEDHQRRQLARDLHDAIGQTLSAIKLELETRSARTGQPDLDDIAAQLCAMHRQIRTLTFELYPAMLDDLGLFATLEHYAGRLAPEGVCVTVRELGRRRPLSPTRASFVFRAARELLHNVVKHARAREALVTLVWSARSLRLSVVDDGVGLGDRDPWSSGGLGLFDIRERVTYLGGRMQLDSTATGTHVILDVPLEHHGTPEGP